jgi:serine/threonine protein kinase
MLQDIVHGDIKPENVLIFKEKSGMYGAKVIDFGYSTRYMNEDQRLKLAISTPWNAPENIDTSLKWNFDDAKNTDIFSFGMVCLWLLFEPYFSESAPTERSGYSLRRAKEEPRTCAHQLLASETALKESAKNALAEFFDSSLCHDPKEREMCLPRLVKSLIYNGKSPTKSSSSDSNTEKGQLQWPN